MPLYTRYLSPIEFGVYVLIDVAILVIVTVAQLGLGVSYLKWFAEIGAGQRTTLLGSVLLTTGASGFLGGALLWFGMSSGVWREQVHSSLQPPGWTILALVTLESMQGALLNDLRARGRAVTFVVMTLTRFCLLIGGSVVCVGVLREGVHGIFLGRLIADAGAVSCLIVHGLSSWRVRFSWILVRKMMAYGLPLVWCSLCATGLDASGRYIVNHYRGLEEAGLYGLAVKISGVFQLLFIQPFGLAWGGLMFQMQKRRDAQVVYSRVLSYSFVLSLTIALMLALFTPVLMRVFATGPYAGAGAVIPMVLLVRALSIMEYPAAIGLYLSGRTQWFPIIYSLGFVLGVGLSAYLGRTHGMLGVVGSWAIAWAFITAAMFTAGQRYYPLRVRPIFFILPILAWTTALLTGQAGDFGDGVSSWLFRFGMALTVATTASVVLWRDLMSGAVRGAAGEA